MAIRMVIQHLPFIFGLLGNILSIMVYLAPVPTFYTIVKRKSSEGFQSIPYVVGLFSATLLLFYAFLKGNEYMLISINGFGFAIKVIYLILYVIYASKGQKVLTLRLVLVLNLVVYGLIITLTILLVKEESKRVQVVGCICAAFTICVFAAPLGVMRRVITTKSVEYMPFTLSLTLTLSAIMWLFYGFFKKDIFIAVPNILGILLGIAQMIIYFVYKDRKMDVEETPS